MGGNSQTALGQPNGYGSNRDAFQIMAQLLINLSKLKHNIRWVQNLCVENRVQLVGVVKGCNALSPIIEAFEEMGVQRLGMSRMEDAAKTFHLLAQRPYFISIPSLQQVEGIVESFQVSLHSELKTIEALAEVARRRRRSHGILVMVDSGDLREGVLPRDVNDLVRCILNREDRYVKFLGLGANLGCRCIPSPTEEDIDYFGEIAAFVKRSMNVSMDIVSIGGSVVIPWMENQSLPNEINQVRIGESILLGNIPPGAQRHDPLSNEVFILRAAVVEVKEKPFKTLDKRSPFSNRKNHDGGSVGRIQALLDVGFLDTDPLGLTPRDHPLKLIAATSDYTLADATACDPRLQPGEVIDFSMNYQALVRMLHAPHLTIVLVD
jgi:predicted amino acid racemase